MPIVNLDQPSLQGAAAILDCLASLAVGERLILTKDKKNSFISIIERKKKVIDLMDMTDRSGDTTKMSIDDDSDTDWEDIFIKAHSKVPSTFSESPQKKPAANKAPTKPSTNPNQIKKPLAIVTGSAAANSTTKPSILKKPAPNVEPAALKPNTSKTAKQTTSKKPAKVAAAPIRQPLATAKKNKKIAKQSSKPTATRKSARLGGKKEKGENKIEGKENKTNKNEPPAVMPVIEFDDDFEDIQFSQQVSLYNDAY